MRALDHPVHSGMWGGPVMDALTALTQILSRLVTPEGRIAIPNFEEGIEPLDEHEKNFLLSLPRDPIPKDVGAVAGLKAYGRRRFPPFTKKCGADRRWRS